MAKKATALTMVLVIMIIVGIGTTAVLKLMVSYADMRRLNVDRLKSQYLAEAGVVYGMGQLQKGNAASPVTITEAGRDIVITKEPLPDGSYRVYAVVQTGDS